jgi:hypothetical protein
MPLPSFVSPLVNHSTTLKCPLIATNHTCTITCHCPAAACPAAPGDRSGFRVSKRPMFGRSMCLLALQKPGARNLFSICRPNTGGWVGWVRGLQCWVQCTWH